MKAKAKQGGFAILAAVFVLVIFAVLGMAAVSLIAGSAGMVLDEVRSQQAFDLANAGLEFEAEQLEGDSDWSDNTGYTKSFGPGSFTISYVSQAQKQATVRVDGTVGGITRSVQQDFQYQGSLPVAFTVATYSQGDMRARNQGTIDVDGDSNLGGSVIEDNQGDVDISGASTENNPSADIPAPDASYWLSVADHVIYGNYRFNSGTYNGIYYITGRARVQSNDSVTINGTIAAVGNVIFRNQSATVITAASGNPAIVTGGRVLVRDQAQVDIFGWIVAMNDFLVRDQGDVDIVGGVTAANGIQARNQGDLAVEFDENRAPGTDGFTGGEGGGGGGGGGMQETNWTEVF